MTRIGSSPSVDSAIISRVHGQAAPWQPTPAMAQEHSRLAAAERDEPLVQLLMERADLLHRLRGEESWPYPLMEGRVVFNANGFQRPTGNSSAPLAEATDAVLALNRSRIRMAVRELALRTPPELAGQAVATPAVAAPALATALAPYEPALLNAVRLQNDALHPMVLAARGQATQERAAAALLKFVYPNYTVLQALMDGMRGHGRKQDCMMEVMALGQGTLYLTPRGFVCTHTSDRLHKLAERVPLPEGDTVQSFCQRLEEAIVRRITAAAMPFHPMHQRRLAKPATKPNRLHLPDAMGPIAFPPDLLAQAEAKVRGLVACQGELEKSVTRLPRHLRALEKTPQVKALRRALRDRSSAEKTPLVLTMGTWARDDAGLAASVDVVLSAQGFGYLSRGVCNVPVRAHRHASGERADDLDANLRAYNVRMAFQTQVQQQLDAASTNMEPLLQGVSRVHRKRWWH